MPPIRVGSLQVSEGIAACADLHSRHMTRGNDVYGIVPVEFLRDKILRVDLDRGKLSFLRSVPRDAGQRFELTWKQGTPWLALDLPGVGKEEFQIASQTGFKSGALRKPLFDGLIGSGWMKLVRGANDSRFSPVDPFDLAPQAMMDHFVVGPFRHDGAIFSAAEHSRLELGYLSRYNVTFDFAHSAMYLKPGGEYSRRDLNSALAGLLIAAGPFGGGRCSKREARRACRARGARPLRRHHQSRRRVGRKNVAL
jgi:hypothetical protein